MKSRNVCIVICDSTFFFALFIMWKTGYDKTGMINPILCIEFWLEENINVFEMMFHTSNFRYISSEFHLELFSNEEVLHEVNHKKKFNKNVAM